jgi:hypothetical protein
MMEKKEKRWLGVDLHTHTWHSHDSWMSPAVLVERARAAGLDRVAVTDHGEIEGAFEAQAIDPELIIVGQEIDCAGGTDLIGLFMRERIPNRLSVEATAERIRAQGGVVYAPHPFAYALRGRWHAERAIAVADIVEVFNSRAFLPPWNRSARVAAILHERSTAASTDCHFGWEPGRAYTMVPWFEDAASLLAVAHQARPVGVRTASPFIHLVSVSVGLVKRSVRSVRRLSGRNSTLPRLDDAVAG